MLTAVILTLNEERNIRDCLASVSWADELVVFDSYSTDQTVQLAKGAGAHVIQYPFENYGAQRDAALVALTAEWVFFVDADERATPELEEEIRSALDRPERGWWVPRHNYIFGRLTLGAGWYPDYQLRLLHRTSARYDPKRPVHEEVILNGDSGHLQNPLIHYNYDNLADFIRRQEKYTDFEAGIQFEAGRRPKPWTYITGPLRQFWWRFVILQGYRDGVHGLRLSALMAYYNAVMWRRVAGLWRASQGDGKIRPR